MNFDKNSLVAIFFLLFGDLSNTLVDNCNDINIDGWSHNTKPAFDDGGVDPLIADISRDPKVASPVNRGVSQYIPTTEFPDQTLLKCGFLDVTQAPYNVDNNGDDRKASTNTTQINHALKDAREYMLVTYFPEGDYHVNGTLECVQGLKDNPDQGGNDRQAPCMAYGARKDGGKPKIILEDGTFPLVLDDPTTTEIDESIPPKPIFYFWARGAKPADTGSNMANDDHTRHQASISFNQTIVGFDFDMGNNPGGVAIELSAAQGSGAEDITVTGTDFYAGMRGFAGAGGSSHNITVIGGRYGIDNFDHITVTYDPNLPETVEGQHADRRFFGASGPTLSGITLSGQSEAALRYTGLETLSLVGASITVPSGTDRAIELSGYQKQGFLSMVDSQIVFESQSTPAARAAVYQEKGYDWPSGIYMRNVYVQNATDITNNVAAAYPGKSDGWLHVNEYTTANITYQANGNDYQTPTWIDGTRQATSLQDGVPDETPPVDLQSRHKWDESTFPYWDRPGAVNIKLAPYNAKGDFNTDDTAVIQAAIDNNEVIFFPKGYYRVTQTLRLQPNTKLIGAGGRTSSVIIACNGATNSACNAGDAPGTDFNDVVTPSPVIESADDANGTATMAFIGVHSPIQVPGAYQLLWQTGRHSLFRLFHMWQKNIYGDYDTMPPDFPNIIFDNNGGGRWYSYFHDFWWPERWGKSGHESFRHFKIDGTREPIHFYQFNPESQNDAQFTELEINDAHNVNIYGFKDEGIARAALIKDSENINIYGGAGNAHVRFETPSEVPGDPVMYEIIDSNNIRLVSMLSRGATGSNADHDDYSWIRELHNGVTIETDNVTDTGHHDRPMLYKRGSVQH